MTSARRTRTSCSATSARGRFTRTSVRTRRSCPTTSCCARTPTTRRRGPSLLRAVPPRRRRARRTGGSRSRTSSSLRTSRRSEGGGIVIGLKSVAAIVISASLVAVAAARGTLAPSYLAALGGSSWFLIGLLATLLLGLVGVGWRFGVRGGGAIRFVARRRTLVGADALVT